MRFITAIFSFFGRLLRDIWLEVWRPIRKQIVKWTPVIAGCLLLLWLWKTDPGSANAIFSMLIMIAIMFFVLKFFISVLKKMLGSKSK